MDIATCKYDQTQLCFLFNFPYNFTSVLLYIIQQISFQDVTFMLKCQI